MAEFLQQKAITNLDSEVFRFDGAFAQPPGRGTHL